VFATVSYLQSCQIFLSETGAYPSGGSLLALSTNRRKGCRWLLVMNTLANYSSESVTTVISLMKLDLESSTDWLNFKWSKSIWLTDIRPIQSLFLPTEGSIGPLYVFSNFMMWKFNKNHRYRFLNFWYLDVWILK
jgi:hypothetical protein